MRHIERKRRYLVNYAVVLDVQCIAQLQRTSLMNLLDT